MGQKGEVVGRVPKPGEFDRALSMVENYKLKVAALRKQVEELEGKGKKTVKEVKVKSKPKKVAPKKTVPKKKEK
jgi:hypothetical protein